MTVCIVLSAECWCSNSTLHCNRVIIGASSYLYYIICEYNFKNPLVKIKYISATMDRGSNILQTMFSRKGMSSMYYL